jgi:hypothetical protein
MFTLDKEEVDILRKATTEGFRGLVWFDNFAISVPHIMHISIRSRKYWKIEGGSMIEINWREYKELKSASSRIKELTEKGGNG